MSRDDRLDELLSTTGWSPLPDSMVDALCGDLPALGLYVVVLRRARRHHAVALTPRGQLLHHGQALVGERELGDRLGLSRKVVRAKLRLIADVGIWALERAHRGTVVTLLQYDRYLVTGDVRGPVKGPTEGPQRAHRGPTEGPKRDVIRKTKDEIAGAREGAPLPDQAEGPVPWSEASKQVDLILDVLSGDRSAKRTRSHLELVPDQAEVEQ